MSGSFVYIPEKFVFSWYKGNLKVEKEKAINKVGHGKYQIGLKSIFFLFRVQLNFFWTPPPPL